MRASRSLLLFCALAAGFHYAQAASLVSDESDETFNGNDIAELQKRDQMEMDAVEMDEDQRLEDAHYLEEGGDEETEEDQNETQQDTDNIEDAGAMEAESEAGAFTEGESQLLDNKSELEEDQDNMRQKREHIEEEESDELDDLIEDLANEEDDME